MSQQINPEQLAQMIQSVEARIACKKEQQAAYRILKDLAPAMSRRLFPGPIEAAPGLSPGETIETVELTSALHDFFSANFDWEALDIADMEIQLAALKQAQAQMSSVIQIPQVRPNNKKPAW